MSIKSLSISAIQSKQEKAMIEALTELGHKAAIEAYKDARYNGKAYVDRTFNLNNSYGSAVYVNGDLIEDSIRYVNEGTSRSADERAPSGYSTGAEALRTYFKSAFVVRKMDNYTVLVAAAMWYASMVEKGYTVLQYDKAKQYMATHYQSVVAPILKKYGLDWMAPVMRKGIGVDTEFFRFGGSRHKD